jgi:hypothetical protein
MKYADIKTILQHATLLGFVIFEKMCGDDFIHPLRCGIERGEENYL